MAEQIGRQDREVGQIPVGQGLPALTVAGQSVDE